MKGMKNISVLKNLKIILLVVFIFQLIDFFNEKNGSGVYQIISACVLFGGLIFAFIFGRKLEQEKIDIEERKSEAKKINSNVQ